MATGRSSTDGASRDTAPVVLFDFDGVLIRGDSYAHFVRRELKGSRWHTIALLPVMVAALPMLRMRALRRHGQRLVVRSTFFGWSAGRFEAKAVEFGRQLAADPGLVVREAVDAMRQHLLGGARVVVVTQSADTVVRATLDEWGLPTVELVASQPTYGRLGVRAAMRNHGAEKVRQLAGRGIQPPWDVAYTDSLSDLPMLHGADHPVLVNPDDQGRADARRDLGARVSFVTWS